MTATNSRANAPIPWLGARKFAYELQNEIKELQERLETARKQLDELGALPIAELRAMRVHLEEEIQKQRASWNSEMSQANAALGDARRELDAIKKQVVDTEDAALLQEVGIYKYRHPLADVVAYENRLKQLDDRIKAAVKADGGAVLADTDWTVNGSKAAGRTMIRETSKLMLRAFNAEADGLVRGLKPYKVDVSIERLRKVVDTIAKLGKTINIRISEPYLSLRVQELELTGDYLAKLEEQKAAERAERERLREERKVQQEIERERARLEKERQHFANALAAIQSSGDVDAIARVQEQLADVNRAIEGVDYRAANIRAGYVYVISNIGSFGERMVKIGMTRRLDPMERVRELSDASVPFNFDVHALFFSKDAVGIETKMHEILSSARVNMINKRREFFQVTPLDVKKHLAELAGELLQFEEVPEALEYRQSVLQKQTVVQSAANTMK